MPRPTERKDDQSATRPQIIRLLRRWGEGSVASLAVELEITESAVRQHIAALTLDGMVEYREVGQGPGRRRRMFRATDRASRLFPDRYEFLLLSILEEIDPAEAERALVETLRKQRERLLPEMRQAFEADGVPFRPVMDVLDRWRFMPSLIATEGETPELVLEHCPVWSLAQRFTACCDTEVILIEESAPGWTAERTAWRHNGDASCRYQLKKPAAS
ncbi:MAG: helix-turn-helix transcriptional regulator [Dehalococcoidia bacterium]